MAKIAFLGKTDIGLVRGNNEDAFVVAPDRGFAALADGMGGRASGEVASRIFVETVSEALESLEGRSEEAMEELVQRAFSLANERILAGGKENPRQRGMGCTAELMVFSENGYVLGHVGDSRTYRFRHENLTQLSRDHSVVQDQIEQGLIGPEEARGHALRNLILRAVGAEDSLAVDLIRGKYLPGDLYLLCSDGLSDLVEDPSIREVLALPLSLAGKAEKLVELAKHAGGYDNITVILCEVATS